MLARTRRRGDCLAVYLIIFGAAVRADGTPSGSLRRRAEGALAFARTVERAKFIPTGGVGRWGPAEGVVLREMLLASGVERGNIILEDRAHDTLESIRLCDAILAGCDDVEAVVPCTSPYHIPRCALLLRMLGYAVIVPKMPADRPELSFGKWFTFVLKEFIALPYDAVLLTPRWLRTRRRAPGHG